MDNLLRHVAPIQPRPGKIKNEDRGSSRSGRGHGQPLLSALVPGRYLCTRFSGEYPRLIGSGGEMVWNNQSKSNRRPGAAVAPMAIEDNPCECARSGADSGDFASHPGEVAVLACRTTFQGGDKWGEALAAADRTEPPHPGNRVMRQP